MAALQEPKDDSNAIKPKDNPPPEDTPPPELPLDIAPIPNLNTQSGRLDRIKVLELQIENWVKHAIKYYAQLSAEKMSSTDRSKRRKEMQRDKGYIVAWHLEAEQLKKEVDKSRTKRWGKLGKVFKELTGRDLDKLA